MADRLDFVRREIDAVAPSLPMRLPSAPMKIDTHQMGGRKKFPGGGASRGNPNLATCCAVMRRWAQSTLICAEAWRQLRDPAASTRRSGAIQEGTGGHKRLRVSNSSLTNYCRLV